MTGHHRPSKGTRIEQAIAYGRTLDWITANFDATDRDIRDAYSRIAQAAASTDEPLFDPAPTLVHSARPVAPVSLLQPCGTHSAHVRHRYRGEQPCDACVDGEHTYQAARHARRYPERVNRGPAPLDEVAVERIMNGTLYLAPNGGVSHPELIEAVRRLHLDHGLSDAQIGARVGRSGGAVYRIRYRHGITQQQAAS